MLDYISELTSGETKSCIAKIQASCPQCIYLVTRLLQASFKSIIVMKCISRDDTTWLLSFQRQQQLAAPDFETIKSSRTTHQFTFSKLCLHLSLIQINIKTFFIRPFTLLGVCNVVMNTNNFINGSNTNRNIKISIRLTMYK